MPAIPLIECINDKPVGTLQIVATNVAAYDSNISKVKIKKFSQLGPVGADLGPVGADLGPVGANPLQEEQGLGLIHSLKAENGMLFLYYQT